MKYLLKVAYVVGSILMLNACAPINTQFSCNETARDKCLSIEEAYALTEKNDKDVPLHGGCQACDKEIYVARIYR